MEIHIARHQKRILKAALKEENERNNLKFNETIESRKKKRKHTDKKQYKQSTKIETQNMKTIDCTNDKIGNYPIEFDNITEFILPDKPYFDSIKSLSINSKMCDNHSDPSSISYDNFLYLNNLNSHTDVNTLGNVINYTNSDRNPLFPSNFYDFN